MPIEPVCFNFAVSFSFLGKPCCVIGTFYLSAYTVITSLDLVRTEWQTSGHICYNITDIIFKQKFRWELHPLGL